MSTPDVPGARAQNRDTLHVGCWAEHADGSLIYVEGTEGGNVVYSMFDVARDPVVEYRDTMPEAGFKSEFSWPNKSNVRWTWHDKTPFDWRRVMAKFPAGVRTSSAAGVVSAAARVAESLDLRANPDAITSSTAATGMMAKIRNAIGRHGR